MPIILAVAIGGACGAVSRFLVSRLMIKMAGPGFPWATLTVNIAGAFILGFLVTLLASRYHFSPVWQAFVVTGLLGGFTTFSAFSLEVALMLERHEVMLAGLYAGGSVVFGVGALFTGLYAARYIG